LSAIALGAAASGAGCAYDTPNWTGPLIPAITNNATIAVFRMFPPHGRPKGPRESVSAQTKVTGALMEN
jgi:hypothetical protein